MRTRVPDWKRALAHLQAAAILVLLGLILNGGGGRAAGIPTEVPIAGVAKGAAEQLVGRLLRHPGQLRLVGARRYKGSFFFRIRASQKSPSIHFTLLVACKAGKVAIVVTGANGRDYGYYTDGLLVLIDTKHPGCLDLFRGVSPVLALGGRAGGRHRSGTFAFAMAPVPGPAGKVVLDLSGPVKSALIRASWSRLQRANGTATFYGKHGTLALGLSGAKSAFPIRSLILSSAGRSLAVLNISRKAEPLESVFGITMAKLKASGVPLRICKYRGGESLPLLPPIGFGFNRGEIMASEAMERLMPIDETRARAKDERWISQQIVDLQKSAASDYGAKSGIVPMIRIFSAIEWGLHRSVDTEAQRTVWRNGHPAYSYFSWKFSRAAYGNILKQTWGKKQVDHLTSVLAGIALSADRGLTQKLVAVDLLSDIGPWKADHGWAESDNTISKVFAGGKGSRNMSSLLLGLIRARWGLPVGARQISAAKQTLANLHISIPLRVRALEILCFTGQLPDDRHEIAKLEKAYLANPSACIADPVPGRYLYDLSLCRNGRKILLEELADRHSELSGEVLLPMAAFNGAQPGAPGYNLAVKTAAKIADDPKYKPGVRKQAFGMLCHGAPMPVFRKLMLARLGENAVHFGMPMEIALTSRKATVYFLPQLADLFANGDDNDKIRILEAIGFGFPKGGDANVAAPLIRSALRDADAPVRWEGVACIGDLKYARARLDVTPLEPILYRMVKNDFKGDIGKEVNALNCFSLATKGRWQMPAVGMMPYGLPNLQANSGLTWWQEHYAAVRRSALRWAAAHPNYPKKSAKVR